MLPQVKSILIAPVALSLPALLRAQSEADTARLRLSARELAIPTAPVFDLMGVAPSQVARTSDIKDFKVDWSFKSWKLNPNLAIQAQPVWEVFFNRRSLSRYQQASRLARTLASIDVSVGTVQAENSDRRIGGAVKVNLYKGRDPLLRKGFYDDVEKAFADELAALKETEQQLTKALDTATTTQGRQSARAALLANDDQLRSFHARRNAAIREKSAEFVGDYWNAPFVDVAYGQVYTYATDSTGGLRGLRINRNTGKGLWLNAGFPLGRSMLVSGLARSTYYSDEVSFVMTDTLTATDTTLHRVVDNNLLSLGLNVRYGTPVYNFFAEFFYETKTTVTKATEVSESFVPAENQVLTPGTTKWDIVSPYTYAIGGEWRISRNLLINYAIRCLMDKQWRTTSVIPVAGISCMMR